MIANINPRSVYNKAEEFQTFIKLCQSLYYEKYEMPHEVKRLRLHLRAAEHRFENIEKRIEALSDKEQQATAKAEKQQRIMRKAQERLELKRKLLEHKGREEAAEGDKDYGALETHASVLQRGQRELEAKLEAQREELASALEGARAQSDAGSQAALDDARAAAERAAAEAAAAAAQQQQEQRQRGQLQRCQLQKDSCRESSRTPPASSFASRPLLSTAIPTSPHGPNCRLAAACADTVRRQASASRQQLAAL